MPHAGQQIDGPGGFRLLLVRVEGGVLEMEAAYPGGARMPPEHLHPRQAERFEVLEGAVEAVIDGARSRFSAGNVFEVPVGVPHQMAPADGPARVRWEVRPALRTAEFFERLYGEGPDSARALGAAFLEEFSEEIRLTGG